MEKEKVNSEESQEVFVDTLDPEMDLRNINFATGENRYLVEKQQQDLE